MKKYSWFLFFLSVFAFQFCGIRDEPSDGRVDLYELACKQKDFLGGKLQLSTRDEISLEYNLEPIVSSITYDMIDPVVLKYIDKYTSSKSIAQWNEASICKEVARDNALSADQREVIARSLGYGMYYKEIALEFGEDIIQAFDWNPESAATDPCLTQYYLDVRYIILRGIKDAAFGIGGGVIGLELAIIGGEINILFDLRGAKKSFMACIAAH